jgi:lipoprotein-releasing system ATP-binding protein
MIELEALSFAYRERDVLTGMDAIIEPGSATALVGRSGSGKSTLLYLIGLMLTPRSGSLRIGGVETATMTDQERANLRAESIGFVFQDALLDPALTVLGNVLESTLFRSRSSAARAADRERAIALLDRFGVEVEHDRLPGEISGGQAQRVALCRALVKEPTIVLADEPTGNLDAESAELVWSALRDCADAGAAVVVATHDRTRASTLSNIIEVGNGATR